MHRWRGTNRRGELCRVAASWSEVVAIPAPILSLTHYGCPPGDRRTAGGGWNPVVVADPRRMAAHQRWLDATAVRLHPRRSSTAVRHLQEPVNGLLLDIRRTLRSLWKTGAIFAIALVTIALGVGANTAMFSVVHAVVLSPLPYAAPERLVSLWPEKRWSSEMLQDVRDRVSSYEAISAWRSTTFTLLGDALPEPATAALVSAAHFDVLGVRPLRGRTFTPEDETGGQGPVALLSHDFWQRRYGGDPSVLGRSIRLAGGGAESRTVVGVLPPDFVPLPPDVEVWVPLGQAAGQPGYFNGYGMSVIGRLRPGVTAAQALPELRRLVDELTPLHPTQFRPIRYSPVDVVPLRDQITKGVRTQLVVLLGAVGFILLIACTNVANLLLARAHGRQRDVAVQMALGCSRGRIFRQVLTESLALGLGGGAVGVLVAALATPVIRDFVAPHLPRTEAIAVDGTVLAFALAVSLLAGFIFGAMPAFHATRATPGEVMRASAGRGHSQGRRASRVNDALVVAEIALSLMLLAGAGLMLKSLWRLANENTGFTATNVLAMQLTLPPGRYDSLSARAALLRDIEERLGAIAGVETTGTINILPLSGAASGFPYRVEGEQQAEGTSQVVSTRIVTPAYFEALDVPLVRGRMFGAGDVPNAEPVLLVNEAFARQHWPAGDPLGARLLSAGAGEPIGRIVGVVGDMRQKAVAEAPDPEIYGAVSQFGWQPGYLLVRGARELPPQTAVLEALRAAEPLLGVRDVRPMEEVVRASMGSTRFYARLLTGFAVLALLLGLVGVYGVMTYAASRRTREFGVRLALGATPRDLLFEVIGRAMVPVVAGIALGVAGALALTRLISSILYGVEAGDPWVLAGVALLLAAAAAVAALLPAARVSRLSPVHALQSE